MCALEQEQEYYVKMAKTFIDNYLEELLPSIEISQNYPFVGYDFLSIKEIINNNKDKINNDISDLTLFSYIIGDMLIDKLNTFEGK